MEMDTAAYKDSRCNKTFEYDHIPSGRYCKYCALQSNTVSFVAVMYLLNPDELIGDPNYWLVLYALCG